MIMVDREEFCCDTFKYHWEMDPRIHQDDIHRDERDGNLYFYFEGCRASCPLIYCPNCGKKLEQKRTKKRKI